MLESLSINQPNVGVLIYNMTREMGPALVAFEEDIRVRRIYIQGGGLLRIKHNIGLSHKSCVQIDG